MAGEIPRPERYRRPEGGLFNVSAMTSDQVVALGRALDGLAALESQKGRLASAECDDTIEMASDHLWNALAVDVGRAATQTERGKEVLVALAASDNHTDFELAVTSAVTAAESDYAFASDMLVSLYRRGNERIAAGDNDMMEALDVFIGIEDDMREKLPPEQVADFEARMGAVPLWQDV